MSDLVNALNQQSRSSGLVDVLSRADVANPLAAINAGNQAASNLYDLKQKQANQAAGQAFLNSIDPATGQPNQALLMQNLQADPRTAMAAQESAQKGQNLDTTTYNLHNARLDGVMSGAGQLIADNPNGIPAADLRAYLDQQHQLKNLTDQEYQQAVGQISADPRQNSAFVLRGIGHGLQAKTALDAAKPPTGTVDVGGRVVTTQTNPQLGTSNAPALTVGPGVTTGPQPGAMVQTSLPVDDQGVIPLDANGNPTRTPKRWDNFNVPVQTAPGMPRGGQPVPAPGGPAQPGSNAPPPPPPGATIRSPGAYPGQRSDIPSSSQVASADNTFVPSNLPAASAASGAVAGDVAAIQGGMRGAQATPSTGTQTAQLGPYLRTAPPTGYTERLKQDQDQYAGDQRNLNNRYTNVQNLNTAIQALQLTNTGRSTGAVHNFYSFLASQGIAPGFVDNDVTQYDIARKAMMAFAASRAGPASSDLARTQAEFSNASPEIAQEAALHVLRQNLGNERMEIAANQQHADKSGAGYGESKAKFYQDNDPRAFAWDVYTPEQRAEIIAEVSKTEGGYDKLKASLKRALDLKLVPKPAQSSEATPASNIGPPAAPAPVAVAPPNALAMATPANALAA